jgi:uncharacterized membrane protein YeaQ/YmgE (transglycosylase-associated protein family)
MIFYFINVGLTYLAIGMACAVYFTFILRKPMLGRFWGALIVGLIGSFLGGLIDQLFPEIIAMLADFNSVNVFAAVLTSLLMIWILVRVSASK